MPTWTSADLDDPVAESYMVDEASANTSHSDAAVMRRGLEYDPILKQGLVGWWPLHTGEAVDLSGNSNDGTINGATTGVAGRMGLQAMSFDGTDDDVTVGTQSIYKLGNSLNNSGSIWFKTSTSGNNNLIARTNGVAEGWFVRTFEYNGVSYINVTYRRDDGSGDFYYREFEYDDGEWHNLTWVRTGSGSGGVDIYVDGNLLTTDSNNLSNFDGVGTYDIGSQTLYIGRREDGNYWQGSLSLARIYDRSLSQSEIQTLYEWGNADLANPADNNDGGVSYYSFNSSNADDSWGSNDGTVNGATYVSDGGPRGDGAYSFDGTDDDITVPHDSTLSFSNESFSVSHWIKPNELGDNASLSKTDQYDSNDVNYLFQSTNADGISFLVGSGSNFATAKASGLILNNWYHVVGVYDHQTTSISIYVNGELKARNNVSFTLRTNTDSLRIGEYINGNRRFDGSIDDARIYNIALSPAEVHELYRYGTFGIDGSELTVRQ